MTKKTLLYEIPKVLESAEMLDASILPAYKGSIKNYSETAQRTLNVFGDRDGILVGSNPFALVQLKQVGLLNGRLANRQDLENAKKYGMNLSGTYIDFGLALRTRKNPNGDLASKLLNDLEERKIEIPNGGALISLNDLKIEQADNNRGLQFRFTGNSVDALKNHSWNYTANDGLSGAFLGSAGGWGSDDGFLADSVGDGRVVVVSAEGTPQKFFDELKSREQIERKAYLKTLKDLQKYAKVELARLDK